LYALGNERPAALLEVEQALCNCIMRIMGGSDAVTQLQRFLEEYDAMKLKWAANGITDLHHNFFDNGKAFSSQVHVMPLMCSFQPSLHFLLNLPPM
jgi:hypothetical protein